MATPTLIEQCIANDRAAQKQLYHQYAKEVANICFRYVKDTSTTKDLMQECFITAFSKMHQYRSDKGSFGAWICRIASNKSIDYLRSKNSISFDGNGLDEQWAVEGPDPTDNMAAEDLLQLINTLPEQQRIIFQLSVVDGYTHLEISEILDIPAATSRSHLLRARTRLQVLLTQSQDHAITRAQ
jgi:RNA polymerase sigma-70 factor (ECF subfamily)